MTPETRILQPSQPAAFGPKPIAILALVPLLLAIAPLGLRAQQPYQYPQPQYAQPNYSQPQYAPQQPQYTQPQPYSQPQYAAPAQQYDQAPQYQGQPQQAPYDQNQGYAQPDFASSQAAPQPLGAEQLEQMVAPIALYPDTLIAQILAASTYPAQVVGADHWLQAQGNVSLDQIAYGANAQSWDPSVKGLTAFPQVLTLMDRDLQWTTDLGNAYYNQPQDVLQTVQVLRQRAQSAGNLQSTPQETVSDNQGYLQVAPANSQVVYVPAYNPWDVYGQPVQPYSGFSLLGSLSSFAGSSPVQFGLGLAMSAFNHTPFGWATWALNWLSQSVLFNHSNYTSQSTSVARYDNPRNGLPPRTPRGYDNSNRGSADYARQGNGYDGYNRSPGQTFTRPPVREDNFAENRPYRNPEENRGFQQPGNFVRPALRDTYAYNRPQTAMPVRPQSYERPNFGAGSYQRPGQTYTGPQQSWRAPQAMQPRNDLAQRGESTPRSYGGSSYGGTYGNRTYAEPRQEKSGGFHLFGGGHNSEKSYGSYKAPSYKASKNYGGGGFKEHSHGSSHSSGGGGGHHSGGHRH